MVYLINPSVSKALFDQIDDTVRRFGFSVKRMTREQVKHLSNRQWYNASVCMRDIPYDQLLCNRVVYGFFGGTK